MHRVTKYPSNKPKGSEKGPYIFGIFGMFAPDTESEPTADKQLSSSEPTRSTVLFPKKYRRVICRPPPSPRNGIGHLIVRSRYRARCPGTAQAKNLQCPTESR